VFHVNRVRAMGVRRNFSEKGSMASFPSPLVSLCFVGSNSEVHYDTLQNRLWLPYDRNSWSWTCPEFWLLKLCLEIILKSAVMSGILTSSEDLIIRSSEKYVVTIGREKHAFLYCIAFSLLCNKICDSNAVLR